MTTHNLPHFITANLKGENRFEKVNCFTFLDSEPKAICFGIAVGIAAGYYDETTGNFIDNGNLDFTTSSLTFSNLNSSSYSTNSSVGGGVSLNQNKQGETLPNASSATYNASSGMSYSKEKTLATLGGGNVTITDTVNSDDLTKLNRDTSKINKELYSGGVSSDVSATVDMRMFTEDGRKDIANDAKEAGLLLDTIAQLGDKSVSFFGDGANGETGFFQSVEDKMALKAASEKFASNPDNADYIAALKNSNATPEQKQEALQAYHQAIADEMGVPVSQVAIIIDMANKGYTSKDGVFVADNLHQTNSDLTNTIANESSDVADLFRYSDIDKTDEYKTNRNEYSDNFGNLGENLLNDALYDSTGSNLVGVVNNHTNLTTDLSVAYNTIMYNDLDKSEGAFRQLSAKEKAFINQATIINGFAIKTKMSYADAQELLNFVARQTVHKIVDGIEAISILNKYSTQEIQAAKAYILKQSEGVEYFNTFTDRNEQMFVPTTSIDVYLNYNPDKTFAQQGLSIVKDEIIQLTVLKLISKVGKPIVKYGEKYYAKLKNGDLVEVDAKIIQNAKTGKIGEELAGIDSNIKKEKIPSLTKTASFRVPDELLKDEKILREIKNVASQSYTRQLKDFNLWAKQEGYTFVLEVREGVKLTKPLQAEIKAGNIILKTLGK